MKDMHHYERIKSKMLTAILAEFHDEVKGKKCVPSGESCIIYVGR